MIYLIIIFIRGGTMFVDYSYITMYQQIFIRTD